MMRDTIIKSTLLAATLALGSYAQAAPSGQALGYTCAGCHGTNGASTGNAIPSIAGLSETYMVETMNAYKSGDKASTIMGRIAKGYSEEDIENMAGFLLSKRYTKILTNLSMQPKPMQGRRYTRNIVISVILKAVL